MWNNLESEIPALLDLIEKYKINCLLLDSYYATFHYLKQVSKYTRIFYIDDLGEIKYPVDTIINYNIYGPEIDYHKLVCSNDVKLLLGTGYVPLRGEFQNVNTVFHSTVKNVFITTGGADFYNIAGLAVYCGDCRKGIADVVDNIIAGNKLHCV